MITKPQNVYMYCGTQNFSIALDVKKVFGPSSSNIFKLYSGHEWGMATE